MGPEGRRLEQGAEEDARRRCSRAWSLSRQKGLGLLQALGRREGAYDCCSEGCRQEAEGAAEVNIGEDCQEGSSQESFGSEEVCNQEGVFGQETCGQEICDQEDGGQAQECCQGQSHEVVTDSRHVLII